MNRNRSIIALILTAIFIRELWELLPEDDRIYTPFPLHYVEITMQTYVAYACYYCSTLILSYVLSILVTRYHEIVKVWFYLQFIEFIDYFLTYNTAWTTIIIFGFHIGVGVSLVKFIILSLLTIHKVYTCKI